MSTKKYLVLAVLCILLLTFTGCGSNKNLPSETISSSTENTVGDSNSSNNENAKESNDTPNKEENSSAQISTEDNLTLGEAVTIHTDSGDLEIAVIGAGYYEDDEEENEVQPISIRCEVRNISFSDEYSEDDFESYCIEDDEIINVTDSSGFSLEYYDLYGPSDGKYAIGKSLQIGEKARVAYLYLADPNETTVTVHLKGDYQITLDIE